MNDQQPLTLEAGKYYRTRNGEKAQYLGKADVDHSDLPHIGLVGKRLMRWHLSGGDDYTAYASYLGGFSGDDLIGEWVEPKRIKGWVNINRHNGMPDDAVADLGGGLWPTRELADEVAGKKRIACIEIDVLEGHGLNGEGA